MIYTVKPGARTGSVVPPVSKSIAHRKLICAALSGEGAQIDCGPREGLSADILATEACLRALLQKPEATFLKEYPEEADSFSARKELREEAGYTILPCGESGSTLRFLLPVAAALGASVVFQMEGLLPSRPHKELIDQLCLHGARIHREGSLMFCEGQISAGTYTIPGGVSSQFISGLLFARPLLSGDSRIQIEGKLESAAYVTMTAQAVSEAGIRFTGEPDGYFIPGGQKYLVTGTQRVEADWSGAAFFLCMGAFSHSGITVSGLRTDSLQGDRRILTVLCDFGAEVTETKQGILVRKGTTARPLVIDASEIPDLVPVISVLAAGTAGTTRITHAERLRFKESDRIATTVGLLRALGGAAEETEDGLLIHGTGSLAGGTVDPSKDHRIAMSAAVSAAICREPVTVLDAECAGKSYPGFYNDLNRLEADG